MLQKFTAAILLMSLSMFSAQAQFSVQKIDGKNVTPESEGLFYSLPQTVIQFDLEVAKIQKVKGPYSEYAGQMLGLTQVINSNSTEYEIRNLKISSFPQPDPQQYYFIALPKKKKEKEAVTLFLSREGMLEVGGQASVAGGVKRYYKEPDNSKPGMPDIASPNVSERMDTIVKKISLDTTVIEQKQFKKTTSAKSTDQKAKEAADFIMKLDESMVNLINGYQEVNYEKGTMEFMYNQMNTTKQEYLELFKGVSTSTTEVFTFYIVPSASQQNISVCRFSPAKGVLPVSAVAGDAVSLKAQPVDLPAGLNDAASKLSSGSETLHGIFYRIPAMADLQILIGGQVKMQFPLLINQFGTVAPLPQTVYKSLRIDSDTGTVREVTLH